MIPRDREGVTAALCQTHAHRQVFEPADIAANARRGKKAAAISPTAVEAVKRIDAQFGIERGISLALRWSSKDRQYADMPARTADDTIQNLDRLLPWNWKLPAAKLAA